VSRAWASTKLHSGGNAILLLGMSDMPVSLFETFVGSLSLLWRLVLSWLCDPPCMRAEDDCICGGPRPVLHGGPSRDHAAAARGHVPGHDGLRGVCVCVVRAQPGMI
jgi:hypothetical protein